VETLRNNPGTDSAAAVLVHSAYFLSMWLAICLLEGFCAHGTCSCMCRPAYKNWKRLCRERAVFGYYPVLKVINVLVCVRKNYWC